jgi:ATP-dependent Clp protease ATP-binding subunit ClpA
VQTKVEDRLADEILRGNIRPGDRVNCDYREGEFVFDISGALVAGASRN